MYGLKPSTPRSVWFGARAIYYGVAQIELVDDRQQVDGGTDEERRMLDDWLYKKGLRRLCLECVKVGLHPDEAREIRFELDGYELTADPKASHGYLYIGAGPVKGRPELDDPHQGQGRR